MRKDDPIRRFFLPVLSRKFFLRAALVAAGAYLMFGHVLIPFRIEGGSMEPNYRDGGFSFCFTGRYWFSDPRRGDVVAVRLAGRRVMYLKRVVALAGDTVEFRQGRLHVNGEVVEEPYVVYPCGWDLAPRQVKKGRVYVVGDNRDVPVENHYFGQTSLRRIAGAPLW